MVKKKKNNNGIMGKASRYLLGDSHENTHKFSHNKYKIIKFKMSQISMTQQDSFSDLPAC